MVQGRRPQYWCADRIGARQEEGYALLALAEATVAKGDARESRRRREQGLAVARKTDDRPVLGGLPTTAGPDHRTEQGNPLPPLSDHESPYPSDGSAMRPGVPPVTF